ncbi:O-antigen translocase [Rhodoferax sp.]|uniref:O-antigen translocase n=1 Tax=Rhodoferax sp. TaxID=50421 RepID=UPI002734A5F1|nr:O-antigen translocase [Rhodoferax sp.]MDP3190359.1 O-antigen translocase [Rhodoferax sp.]
MTDQVASYRRILKSSSIIGGASVINILIGLVRTKIIAVLLGPTGIGLVSLYNGLMTTAAAVATMGIGTVGTRQVAEALAKDDARALAVVRRAMFWGALLLASAGALVVWALREVLAVKVLGGVEHATIVGWLALGVALSVASASQGALIQGMRRIGDMARLSVYGSVLNTVLGVGLLWQWGQAGLVAYVLVGPLSSFVLGHWYVSRLPKVAADPIALQEMAHQWQTLLRLGVPFMGAGLVGALVQLWIRVEVGNTLGAESLGHFQAAWTISMQYIGFVLGAMAADYYPRLTGVIHDPKAATRLVNEQTEIALLLSAPVFIAMIGLAPWVLHLLYSTEFLPAVEVLRWQILGDVLKVASWPLGFVILAAGAGKTFFLSETLVLLLMGGLIASFSSIVGLRITGIAFLVCYVVYLPMVYWLAWRRIGFVWSGSVVKLIVIIFAVCALVAIICTHYWWGVFLTLSLSLTVGMYTLGRLKKMSNFGVNYGKINAIANKCLKLFGRENE